MTIIDRLFLTPKCLPVLSFAVAMGTLAGCHGKRESEGSMTPTGNYASVDNSWVNAAKACWPELAKNNYSTQQLQGYLVVPNHLRATFPSYAGLSDPTLKADLTVPITTVLPPDTTKLLNSSTPVLTTGQAVAGTSAQNAIEQSTHGSAPPDSLCSIQRGFPEGFNQQ